MNNSLADWNMIVSEDKFIKKIDLLTERFDSINILNDKIYNLECKLNLVIDNSTQLNNKNYQENKMKNIEKKLNKIFEKLTLLECKIDSINATEKPNNISQYLNAENSLNEKEDEKPNNISQYLNAENSLNEKEDEKPNNISQYLNAENSLNENNNLYNTHNIFSNISNKFFTSNTLNIGSLGLNSLIDKNNAQERIKNTLWRRNIINYNSNNYYTTTPNIKYNLN
jgi:hypothetical protein